MQKVFRKYISIILTAAILLILVLHSAFSIYLLKNQQFSKASAKIDQIIHTLKTNKEELESIKSTLDEDYLTRAKAAAYVMERNPEVMENPEELQKLAVLLNVDELHVIDEDGIIIYSSVPKYLGIDFHEDEQTQAFLPILDSEDENAYVIQDAQPNAAEGKMMKYIGVARKEIKGIIQVGLEPVRQMEAQERNTYQYIFSRFPTDVGEEYFAVEYAGGTVLGHSGIITETEARSYYQPESLMKCYDGAFLKMEDGAWKYVVTRRYEDVLIGVSMPGKNLFRSLLETFFTTLCYLLIIEMLMILLLNYLVKKKVVDKIHHIINALSDITQGNLDTSVNVGGNREFEELSKGINTMVKSLIDTSNRLSKIIQISGIPLAAFEYQKGMKQVFVTAGLKDLLDLSGEETEMLYKKPEQFFSKIEEIMEKPVDGEVNIYEIAPKKYVRIHISGSEDGYLGVVTDATRNVLKNRRLQYENDHDQLTGLYKYQSFKHQAEEIIMQTYEGKICAVVMMDLDSFKSINDTYGHDTGDKYLIHFADALESLPKEHCLTARRSGDEFCMLLFDFEKKEEIVETLKKFWVTLERAKVEVVHGEKKKIGVSGGVSFVEKAERNIGIFLKQADEALYKAKKEKKGQFQEYCLEDMG